MEPHPAKGGAKLAVIALGGNALLRGNQVGTIKQQEKNTFDTCINLVSLIKNNHNLVITHGNGPQVGNIVLTITKFRECLLIFVSLIRKVASVI